VAKVIKVVKTARNVYVGGASAATAYEAYNRRNTK